MSSTERLASRVLAPLISTGDDEAVQWKPWVELAPMPGFTRNPAVDKGVIERAEAVLGWPLPTALRDLYLATNGLRDDEAQLKVVWPLEELVELAPSVWCADLSAAGLVAFGTDGFGTSFCMRRDGTPTVWAWDPIDSEARAVAASLAEFWTAWTTDKDVATLPDQAD